MRGRDKFERFKKYIILLAKFYSLFPKQTRKKFLIKSRDKEGSAGLAIRYALLSTLAEHMGNNVSIHPSVYIFNPEKLWIGDNVSIHPMCYIEAYGGIKIGNDVSIAHATTIMSVSHGFDNLEIPIKDQELIEQPIEIENNVWVGAKVTLLGNVTVKTGSIVAAGAVVKRNVEECTIVAGVPAREIKRREESQYCIT